MEHAPVQSLPAVPTQAWRTHPAAATPLPQGPMNRGLAADGTAPATPPVHHTTKGTSIMLGWTLIFLVIALIAGALGFGLIGGTSWLLAKICFFVFLIFFVISLLRGRPSSTV